MIYEVLLTLVIILLAFLAYVQCVKCDKIYLFQDTIDLRLSVCYADDDEYQETGRSLVRLRLELLSISPQYRGFCIEYIGFRKKKKMRLRQFTRLFFTGSTTEKKLRELAVIIDNICIPESRLNGLELYITGYLLCNNQDKHGVYQKFIVFERPAILDVWEKENFI